MTVFSDAEPADRRKLIFAFWQYNMKLDDTMPPNVTPFWTVRTQAFKIEQFNLVALDNDVFTVIIFADDALKLVKEH
jgi:hypothetical protein